MESTKGSARQKSSLLLPAKVISRIVHSKSGMLHLARDVSLDSLLTKYCAYRLEVFMRNLARFAIMFSITLGFTGIALSSHIAQDQKTGTITGRVKLDGKPAPGVAVIAAPSSSDPAKTVEQMFNTSASLKATTDSDGVYRLEGVAAGKYRVAPFAPALVSLDANSADEITVAEAADTDGIDFSLSPGGVITGKITDGEGRPVIGEKVSVKAVDNVKAIDKLEGEASQAIYTMSGDRMHSTDDRGIYRIFGLRPGRYIVSAGRGSDMMSAFMSQRPKRVQTYYPSVTDEARAKPVQVTAASEATGVDIQFSLADKGFLVSGRVVDSEKNTPIANAMVAFSKAQKAQTEKQEGAGSVGVPGGLTTTNDKGEFRFESVAPGSYRFEATSVGALAGAGGSQFYADAVVFDVQSANVDKLVIKVHRGSSISGVVVLESADAAQDTLDRIGQLMLMATVIDEQTKSYSSGNCVVAADGSFRLGGLKAGKVTIRPFAMSARPTGLLRIERDGVELQSALELQPNEEITGLRVILAPATCMIRGRVTIQGGALPPGANLSARAHSMNTDPSGVFGNESVDVNSNGTFVIENLAPGSYQVEVSAALPARQGVRSVSVKQTIVVTNSRPAEVDLVLDLSSKASDK